MVIIARGHASLIAPYGQITHGLMTTLVHVCRSALLLPTIMQTTAQADALHFVLMALSLTLYQEDVCKLVLIITLLATLRGDVSLLAHLDSLLIVSCISVCKNVR